MEVNYDRVSLSIYDYSGNKTCTLYEQGNKNTGFAYDIKLTHDNNGWKELSFALPMKVDGEDNPIAGFLLNEHLIKVQDTQYVDWFVISEPRIDHNTAILTINASCNHVSARLRMKKLYLAFDDTNGIGKCHELANIILQGTGWELGECDTFFEAGSTDKEKVRTLTSSGKEGAYQLLNKLCELFNARPIFHGDTKKVDIMSFSPYEAVPGQDRPLVHKPESMVELLYSKGMSGVTRSLNTENMVTRLYVEGEFGDNGYVGIEAASPTGMNFLLNFDYFKSIGLFTPEHQTTVDTYLSTVSALRQEAKDDTAVISEKETALMELWGTADYSIFDITNIVDEFALDIEHVTSLGPEKGVLSGQTVVIPLSDNTHLRTKINTVNGMRITIMDRLPDGKTPVCMLVYRQLASGVIGGKEAAVESTEEGLDELKRRVGDNLVTNSDTQVVSTQHLVGKYRLTENLEAGKQYTFSVWGECNAGNMFGLWRGNGTTKVGDMAYDASLRCWTLTFICPDTADTEKNLISIYNEPSATAASANVKRVKMEFGEYPTPWSPAKDSSNADLIAEYTEKIRVLYHGSADSKGIYELTRSAIEHARHLEEARAKFNTTISNINATEDAFANDMGDLLRDGYWQDKNYVAGQEESLYKDAVEALAVMSKPVATYTLTILNMVGMDAAPILNFSVNSAAHIIDEEASINAWGYIDQVVYAIDAPHNTTCRISTQEARFAGQSFTQVLSQVAETAKELRAKQGVFSRASLISKTGKLATEALDGAINVELNKIFSTTSNYYTDDNGNWVFVSQDGTSAMMLTGEGFMIADGRKTDGTWNWRTKHHWFSAWQHAIIKN